MYKIFTATLLVFTSYVFGQDENNFTKRIIAEGLDDPWEIICDQDHQLWVTESKRYQVKKIDTKNGKSTLVLDLSKERKFPRFDTIEEAKAPWPQGGLMGLALHPNFKKKPYVYLCYVYQLNASTTYGGAKYTGRLVRYSYNKHTEKLEKPQILCDTLPHSNDHNSGRLAVGKVDGENYLFLTVGDGGAGQYSNSGQTNRAQQIQSYSGKILRFNLEPDNDEGRYDQWIPNDNPFQTKRQNAVWTYGHRNAQGIAYAKINEQELLFSTEHGPFGDDEVNLIKKGKNYGHPYIIGKSDGNYDGFAAAVSDYENLPMPWHTSLPTINEENSAQKFGNNYQPPEKIFRLITSEMLESVFTKRIHDAPYVPDTPAVAPSSLAIYTSEEIPGWQNSLLIPSLKEGKLIRLKLNDELKLLPQEIEYFKADVRYRDLAISPDGKSIYLSTDKSEVTSGPSENDKKSTSCKGCIIEYRWNEL